MTKTARRRIARLKDEVMLIMDWHKPSRSAKEHAVDVPIVGTGHGRSVLVTCQRDADRRMLSFSMSAQTAERLGKLLVKYAAKQTY